MSVRLEWMHAEHIAISGLIAGETAADNQEMDLDSSNIALQFVADDGVVIVGDRQSLINLGERIIEMAIYTDDRSENQELKQDLDDSLELLATVFDGVASDKQTQALQDALESALALLGMER